LILYGQSRKSDIDNSIQVPSVAQGLWYGVAFDAIRNMFVMCAARWSWSFAVSMASPAKHDALFVTTAIVTARKNGTLGAIRAMTNLTILDGISRLTQPCRMCATISSVSPARFVVSITRIAIATDFAPGDRQYGDGETNAPVHGQSITAAGRELFVRRTPHLGHGTSRTPRYRSSSSSFPHAQRHRVRHDNLCKPPFPGG
jgi:hypothetical protein